MKNTTKASLGQNTRRMHERTESDTAQDNFGTAPLVEGFIPYNSFARARSVELGPNLPQGTLQPGRKARRDDEAEKTPVHDSVLAGGSDMTPKGHKLLQDSPGGKERKRSTNPDAAAAVQATTTSR